MVQWTILPPSGLAKDGEPRAFAQSRKRSAKVANQNLSVDYFSRLGGFYAGQRNDLIIQIVANMSDYLRQSAVILPKAKFETH